MTDSIYNIPFSSLVIVLGLVALVGAVYVRWSLNAWTVAYATLRMVLQLLLVGYFLLYLFEMQSSWLIVLILSFMLLVASWIALRPVKERRLELYWQALVAVASGGLLTLLVIVGLILPLEPWYEARYVIPIAGMIFSNAMNAVSLAADRLNSELSRGEGFEQARQVSFEASLIPITNSLLAVGLVALPGMMTGQILSGVSPLVAVRYQILVMCMVFSSSGISSAVYLALRGRARKASECAA